MIKERFDRHSGLQQRLMVFAAFFTMVVATYLLVSQIMHKQLIEDAEQNLAAAEIIIHESMMEAEVTLANTGMTLVNMIEENSTSEQMSAYLSQITEFLVGRDKYIYGYDGVYGYICEEYMDGYIWEQEPGFIPQNRPWYQAALGRNGEIAFSTPYIDAFSGEHVVSMSKELVGSDGESYGVLAIDMIISRFTDHVSTLQLATGGYGFLMDQDYQFLVDENPYHLTQDADQTEREHEQLIQLLKKHPSVQGECIYDASGRKVIIYSKQIFNNWHLGLITPVRQFYADLYNTMIWLGGLAVILMAILWVVLYRLNRARIESEEENRSKSSFLAHVSHEIRTPMNSIIGMSELALRDETITDSVFDNVYAIYQSGVNLQSMINNILDVSKIESGKMEIIVAPYRINAVLNEAFNVVKIRLNKKKVRFAVYVDSSIPATLVGDEIRIRQILLNLLSNAAKYTQEGCVILSLSGRYRSESEFLLNIKVEDTGIGIKEKDIKSLFQEFSRVDRRKNRQVEGTGLGLVITKHLCQAMNGVISVESEYGKGSVFTVEIPQAITVHKRLVTINRDTIRPVLMLEDNEIVAEVVKRTFNDLKIPLTIVAKGEELIKYLEQGTYEYVFTPYEKLEATKTWIHHCGADVTLVEMVPRNWSPHSSVISIMLPLYSLPIANIFNGRVSATSVQTVENECRLIAPDANVLIVDDIEVNLKVAEGMLSQFKIKADTCLSGKAALQMVQQKDYDLVFMDHMMPEMDGIEAVRQIRALPGDRFKHLTIIALTANEASGIRELLIGSGMNDYLAKPIELRNLNYILEKWLPRSKQQKEEEGDQIGTQSGDVFAISGINVSDGVKRFGGDLTAYQQVLGSYATHTPKLLEQIKNTIRQPDQYAIAVHGLKGSSYYICAYEVGSLAEQLEQEAKAGNVTGLKLETGTLLTMTGTLIENIQFMLSLTTKKEEQADAVLPDPDLLRQLAVSCKSYDIKGMEDALEQLESYRYEADGELVKMLRTKTEELEYEEVSALITEYLDKRAS